MSDPKNKTILVVDDDVDLLFQMKLQLENAGYSVETAESESGAMEKLETLRPDLAVCDLMMENMDAGFNLSYHIKKIDKNIPVIIVTAVTRETGIDFDTDSMSGQTWMKADAVLAKPIRFEQLIREIERLLEG